MSPSIIILCLVFTTRLSFAINFGYTPQPQPPKVLDDAGDFKPPRDITEKWFKYVNSSSMFQDDPKWGDRDWTPFIESFGIWALFYRTGPPVANYPPPSFSHLSYGGYTYIVVKCYIEGSSYIDVHVSEDVIVGRITKEIISGFQETRIFLTEQGSFYFNITLHLNNPDDVILFDSITAVKDIPVPTTTSSVTTESEGLETTTTTTTSTRQTEETSTDMSTEQAVDDGDSTVTDNWESSTDFSEGDESTKSTDESTESTENSGDATITTEHNNANNYSPVQPLFLLTILTVVY